MYTRELQNAESENNVTLTDTLSLVLEMFQLQSSSAFFVVPDKDCDITVVTLW